MEKLSEEAEPQPKTLIPPISPLHKLVIVGIILLIVVIMIIRNVFFKPDPFSNGLKNSGNMQIQGVPKSLQVPSLNEVK